jgi:hypothetical protein
MISCCLRSLVARLQLVLSGRVWSLISWVGGSSGSRGGGGWWLVAGGWWLVAVVDLL